MLRTTMEAAGFPETITNEVMGIIENLQNKARIRIANNAPDVSINISRISQLRPGTKY